MNVQIPFALLLVASVISSQDDDGDIKKARKHYGLSYHSKCVDYVKSFTCMTTCKSIGFQVFRMDFRCKCSCHELKTTTILPFFKWRTNGTTKTLPSTQSPQLYHIAGTMSPARSINDSDNTETIETTTKATTITCGYPPASDNSSASNSTASDDDSESGNATTVDDGTEGSVSGDVTTVADAAATSVSDAVTTTVAEAAATTVADASANTGPDDADATTTEEEAR